MPIAFRALPYQVLQNPVANTHFSTGHPASDLIFRPNAGIHPPPSAQTPGDPQIEPRAPFYTRPERNAHFPTQYLAIPSHRRRWSLTRVPHIPHQPRGSVSQPLVLALV